MNHPPSDRDARTVLRGDERDPHLALARSESREGPGLMCCTCGQRAQGNYSDDSGPVCDACIEADTAGLSSSALLPEYRAALARGLTESQAQREAFVLTYRITDNAGSYRSREEVIKTVGAYLAPVVSRPYTVAREYVDDHAFMRRHAGETAGAIARDVWMDIPSERWAINHQKNAALIASLGDT